MALQSTDNNNYANNVNAAAEIFAEYRGFIYGIIRSRVKNEAQADDLYQDFFLSLVSTPMPADVQNIKSYLYKAITNDIFDAGRRTERYHSLMHKYADNLNFSINKNGSRNASLNEGKKMDKIFGAMGGCLSPGEAKAIILRYMNSCSLEEVAEEMAVKKESVSRYICTGLKKIRRFLAEK